ncbi:cache domain-containing protein [Thalassobius sp. MITS945101]|uniref:sensor histidine kinase n=1 Tax=Thalassobius sp. MITS945101 TaxID=3096994 RepID=UPI00399B9B30
MADGAAEQTAAKALPKARGKRGSRISVRMRLLAIALLPTVFIMPIFFIITAVNWSARFDNLLIAKVNGELTIAQQYLSRIVESRQLQVESFSDSRQFAHVVDRGGAEELQLLLDAKRDELDLDFLYVLGPRGQVISSPDFIQTDTLDHWPVVRQALRGGSAAAIDLFSGEELKQMSPVLASRARIRLVPTQAAVPTDRTEETRGMFVHTAAPVSLPTGQGALVGGVLLNRNLNFIDTINDLVYPTASLIEGTVGTATLFLDDVRVSTNVRLFQDERALGTRVSAEVRAAVLDEGRTWLDRAFVVNDWYISAYQPITDSMGERVGMLYVGFLETPFRTAKFKTLLTFAAAFVVIVLLSVPLFLRWARQIFRPIERMEGTINRVEAGDLGARTGVENRGDELGRVAEQMDSLLGQIQDRDRELSNRVRERTRALEEANTRLEATTKQLVVSEKLAAVGEIAAGIAHEINNPMTVIQGNLDLIRSEVGPQAEDLKTEFRLIDEQVHSVFVIVNKLLQFTRPDEYAGEIESHHPDEVIEDSIPLVQHLLNKVDIDLYLRLNATHYLSINRTELQQVLINLIVNAIHAMPEGGDLTLRADDVDQDGKPGVMITVQDSGKGMSAEVLGRVFDPFFTTKQGEGTGLGLSISRKIIRRYGGSMQADSVEDEGTRFTLWLPTEEG